MAPSKETSDRLRQLRSNVANGLTADPAEDHTAECSKGGKVFGRGDLRFLRRELLTLAKDVSEEPNKVLKAYDVEVIATALAITLGHIIDKTSGG